MGTDTSSVVQALSKKVEALEHENQKRLAKELQEGEAKFVSEILRGSTTYTQLIVASGYAGAFALWSAFRHLLSVREESLVALLLLVSVAVFVGWNVYQVIIVNLMVRSYKPVLDEKNTDLQAVKSAISERNMKLTRYQVGAAPAWMVVLFITISTAAAAAMIMLNGLVQMLLSVW